MMRSVANTASSRPGLIQVPPTADAVYEAFIGWTEEQGLSLYPHQEEAAIELFSGNNVILAQNIVVSGLNHEYKDPATPIRFQPVTTASIIIEDDCWIAANAVITAGVTIGKHSVIGAGAVVTRSIPPYSVATGNPAKVIKRYNEGMKEWVKVG